MFDVVKRLYLFFFYFLVDKIMVKLFFRVKCGMIYYYDLFSSILLNFKINGWFLICKNFEILKKY